MRLLRTEPRWTSLALALAALVVAGCDYEPVAPAEGRLGPEAAARSSHGTMVLEYTVTWTENGGTVSRVVTPVETAEDIVSFYGYATDPSRPASAATGHEEADVGTLLLHRDTNTGLVSVVVLYDDVGDPDGGRATADLTGLPSATAFEVLDEPGEAPAQLSSGVVRISHTWFPGAMDGFAMRGGFGDPFSFDVTFRAVNGLANFAWADGDGTRTAIPLTDPTSIGISAALVSLDHSPPVITASVDGVLGDNGWYTSDVDVSWAVEDEESEVTETSGCGAVTVDGDTHGVTFTCEAMSAGGTSSESVTIERDATPPAVEFAGNAGTYGLTDAVAITCDATDATSGIASADCPGASGDAWTFGPGTTTLTGAATDRAGNEGTAATSFDVVATAAGICGLIDDWVSNRGVANALCVKLEQADRSGQRGKASARGGQLNAFANQVDAVRGKWLTDERADLLLGFAASL